MKVCLTAVSVLLNAVACCSAAVAGFLANESVFGVPRDTGVPSAARTKNHYANVHANYTEHKDRREQKKK